MSSSPRLSIGLSLPHGETWADGATPGWRDLREMAELAEQAGFDTLWVSDHLLVDWAAIAAQYGLSVSPELIASPRQGVWECWSLLAALAAVTTRVRLGALVTCTGYRNPALLAKMAATVDEISGGRLVLGLGAGDFAQEHSTFGYRWDHRVSRFEEALQIIAPLLREGAVDFTGAYYQARECELRPRGPRPQGPPILIGALGKGPRMMRLVAEYADIWNGWLSFGENRPDLIPPLRAAVDVACLDVGRDPATLTRSVGISVALLGRADPRNAPITGEPEAIAETLLAFAAEGISEVQIEISPRTPAGIAAFAPVLEMLK